PSITFYQPILSLPAYRTDQTHADNRRLNPPISCNELDENHDWETGLKRLANRNTREYSFVSAAPGTT
ncbi:hypothetical protein M8C21_023523, partial [Ambrosia artemisiifolia]